MGFFFSTGGGRTLPGMKPLPPFQVIYQTAEDGSGDTPKPSLIEAEADFDRVLVIDEAKRELTLCANHTATASPLSAKEAPQPVMIKKIRKTTCRVNIHFSKTNKETMSDKIKRLILNDSEKMS